MEPQGGLMSVAEMLALSARRRFVAFQLLPLPHSLVQGLLILIRFERARKEFN